MLARLPAAIFCLLRVSTPPLTGWMLRLCYGARNLPGFLPLNYGERDNPNQGFS